MEIELHPAVSMLPETFNDLVAPVEMLEPSTVTSNWSATGSSSYVATTLAYSANQIAVHRSRDPAGLKSFQLMTILEENHHSLLIVEHDNFLYEGAGEMVEQVAQALKMTDLADRLFCFYEMPRLKAEQRPTRRCQETRERRRLTHGWPQDRPKTLSHQTPRPLLATGDTLKASRTSLLVLA